MMHAFGCAYRGSTGSYFNSLFQQSELARPIPRYSVESDLGCTSRINFDDADDNVTLTLYMTLTLQKTC